jgi:hypothetical protein
MSEKTPTEHQISDFAVDARRAQQAAWETIRTNPDRRTKAIDGISEMAVMHALGELPEFTDEQMAKKVDGRIRKESVRYDKEMVAARVNFALADKEAIEHFEANSDAYHQEALAEDRQRHEAAVLAAHEIEFTYEDTLPEPVSVEIR